MIDTPSPDNIDSPMESEGDHPTVSDSRRNFLLKSVGVTGAIIAAALSNKSTNTSQHTLEELLQMPETALSIEMNRRLRLLLPWIQGAQRLAMEDEDIARVVKFMLENTSVSVITAEQEVIPLHSKSKVDCDTGEKLIRIVPLQQDDLKYRKDKKHIDIDGVIESEISELKKTAVKKVALLLSPMKCNPSRLIELIHSILLEKEKDLGIRSKKKLDFSMKLFAAELRTKH